MCNKSKFIYFIGILMFFFPVGVIAAQHSGHIVSLQNSTGKDICNAVQKTIQEGANAKEIVQTGIKLGHNACLVVKCAIYGGGDLKEIITGAIEAGAPADVISRCALDAGADAGQVARDILLAGMPGKCYFYPPQEIPLTPELTPIDIGLPGDTRGGGFISPHSFE